MNGPENRQKTADEIVKEVRSLKEKIEEVTGSLSDLRSPRDLPPLKMRLINYLFPEILLPPPHRDKSMKEIAGNDTASHVC